VPCVLRFVKKNPGNARWGSSKDTRDTQNQGTSRPYPRPSGGNNNNRNSNNHKYTRPNASRTENENKGASAGNTQNKAGHNHGSDVICYKCGKMGYTLDQYEDYVEVEDYSDEDPDVVYIRAARAMDRSEMEEILFRDLDATSISAMSTLVDENEVSMDLAIIPNGMTPYELLCMLTEETRLMIFCERNEAWDPKWTLRYIGIMADRYRLKVSHRLLSLGYYLEDEIEDAEYLHQLAHSDRDHFSDITGYCVPDHVVCDACGVCVPHVSEMIFTDREGCTYTRTIIRCQTDPTDVFIHAMNDIEDIPRAYHHHMVRPMGMIDHPIRKNGQTLCLAAYMKINGTEAYSLFDSGSITDAVTPDFTRVVELEAKELVKPVTLQLGSSGSHLKINMTPFSALCL
jgi:hypothetical protein